MYCRYRCSGFKRGAVVAPGFLVCYPLKTRKWLCPKTLANPVLLVAQSVLDLNYIPGGIKDLLLSKKKFRATCTACHCPFDKHAVVELSKDTYLKELDLTDSALIKAFDAAQAIAKEHGLNWLPVGIQASEVLITDLKFFCAIFDECFYFS